MTAKLASGVLPALVIAACLLACERKPAAEGGMASAAPAPLASAPAAAARPWFVGTWTARYDATPRAVEGSPKEGFVKQWREDDGGSLTGAGTLTLRIDEAGRVSGANEGALGSLQASGELIDDSLHVSLVPKAAGSEQVTSATVLAKRTGDKLSGSLSASSGDSLRVRHAELVLERTGDAPQR